MQRIPEPELMTEAEQALAYANADFEEPHNHFIELLKDRLGTALPASGRALDLGCGAADISIRFARAFPGYTVDAIDGAEAMLNEGRKALAVTETVISERINLICSNLQSYENTRDYALLFSNSLLHHLHDPMVLWEFVKSVPEHTQVFIMDLMRPDSEAKVDVMVQEYASGEPEILQRDFRNSLFAAFTPKEVGRQLAQAGLTHLSVDVVSDRHIVIRTD